MTVTLSERGDLAGRTVVITGASSGIGREAARALGRLGADLAIVGRDPVRTRAVAEETGGRAFLVDYTSLDSVRSLGDALLETYPRIHVLANNAGGIFARSTTADGFDLTFQVNHLAGFLLTATLLPRLLETAREDPGHVRVIQTASAAALVGRVLLDDLDWRKRRWLGGWPAYGTVKLENILFTRELARRTRGSGLGAYAFHPGYVNTGFGAQFGAAQALGVRVAGISAEEGAEPLVRLASAPKVPTPSGNFFWQLRAPGRVRAQANDRVLAGGLWLASKERVGLSR